MSSRAQQPDTQADIDLRHCVTSAPPTSFNMVAGAGSGKTTSLIKGLASILDAHGDRLRLRRQRVACVTYTEIAAGEIWADVGNNPLVTVSTIHSFFWSIVRGFQQDIAAWVMKRIEEKIATLQQDAAGYSPRVHQKTKDKNKRDVARYEEQRTTVKGIRNFTYGMGSDYPKGILGHTDIIDLAASLLLDRPLFRTLVAQQFPFVFVDESQDTFPIVVEALLAIQTQEHDNFCLGFFGDPMQRIYPTGIGTILRPEGWMPIPKPENFRAPQAVLRLANAIRRDGDDLVQVRGRTEEVDGVEIPVEGTARLFILSSDGDRTARVAQVREWVANANDDPKWGTAAAAHDVKMLVIVHRMAAARLGFGDLYAALNDKAPEAFKSGFLDASAWPLRPLVSFLLPLAEAVNAGRDFEAIQLVRLHSPLLGKASLKNIDVAARLAQLRELSASIGEAMAPASVATIGDVLSKAKDVGLIAFDPRLLGYLEEPVAAGEADVGQDGADLDEESSSEASAIQAYLACPAKQIRPYLTYVAEESPFSTQQGVKGAEYDRVLAVLDDDEGTHNQFSYEKYFGLKPLSSRDQKSLLDGKETGKERTRRLFYVCCTRARQDLAVVLFVEDPTNAIAHIKQLQLFPDADIYSQADLDGNQPDA